MGLNVAHRLVGLGQNSRLGEAINEHPLINKVVRATVNIPAVSLRNDAKPRNRGREADIKDLTPGRSTVCSESSCVIYPRLQYAGEQLTRAIKRVKNERKVKMGKHADFMSAIVLLFQSPAG